METTKDDKVGEPAVGHTVEEPVESQDNTSEKTQGDSQVPVHEKPLTESQQESSTCQQQEGNIKESPAPVAPPRTKRKQKKEALAKESSAPPKPPPPRPKNPPVIVKDIASKDESLQETSSQLDNQPRITVNSDTTDMNKVLLKGSVNEVVKNQDLDECKSPMGSKVNVDAIDKGRKIILLGDILFRKSFAFEDFKTVHLITSGGFVLYEFEDTGWSRILGGGTEP